MAGKVRPLVHRSGRYHARLVIPKDLRGIVGKTELRHTPRDPSVGIGDGLVTRLRKRNRNPMRHSPVAPPILA